MDNQETPFDENVFNDIRNSLSALNGVQDQHEREVVLVDQLLLMNSALEKIYKAVSIAGPAFMSTAGQMNAEEIPGKELDRMIEAHRGHLAAHDTHLAAHDDHLKTLSARIDLVNERLDSLK